LAGVEKVLPVKYWEIIADKLSAAGWSWGMTTATDAQARRRSNSVSAFSSRLSRPNFL
jgi:hypothetical protein